MREKVVCMLSCLHPMKDDRIYWKEALSLKKHGYNVVHLGVGNEEYDLVTEEGIRLISLKRKMYFSNPYIDKLYRTLTFRRTIYKDILKICTSLQADVYHLHDLQLNRIGPKLKKLKQEPKIIYDIHEPYPITLAATESKHFLGKQFWRIYASYIKLWEISQSNCYDFIITTEENVKKTFLHKIKHIPIEIVYNYIDIVPKSSKKAKEFDFIYSGGIRRRRGIFEILTALTILNNRGVETKTLIIGKIHDKGLKQEIKEYISTNKLEHCITLKDFIPYDEIQNYYEASKIGLAIFKDSQVNKTIMPIKIFEYIVFRLPVITSNFGHLKDVTQKYNTGICLNPEHIDNIANQMELLLTDNKLYNKYVSNCEKASHLFNWTLMEKKLLQIYKRIILN